MQIFALRRKEVNNFGKDTKWRGEKQKEADRRKNDLSGPATRKQRSTNYYCNDSFKGTTAIVTAITTTTTTTASTTATATATATTDTATHYYSTLKYHFYSLH